MKKSFLLGALLATTACGAQPETESATSHNEPNFERVNLPPQGVGLPLGPREEKGLMASRFPDVFIDPSITGDDRADLQALLDEARNQLTATTLTDLGTRFDSQYSQVWTIAGVGYRSASQVTSALSSPNSGRAYAPTRLYLWTDPVSGATDKALTFNDENQRDGNLRIRLGPDHLARWRSQDLVERSCAVNTMTHEIVHTLLTRMDGYYPLFVDGETPAKDRGEYGTYLVGAMAQCQYLADQGRISQGDIGICIPVWTTRDPRYVGPVFASGKCDKFPTGPVS